jgi:hypothetical protein
MNNGDANRDDEDGVEVEGDEPYADVADPATGRVRLCAHRCATCVFRPDSAGWLMPGRVAAMVAAARAREGHITCHHTLGTDAPAICRGYADGPDKGASLALRLARALNTLHEVIPP